MSATIDCVPLRNYKGIADTCRRPGNQIYDSVFLDFENEKMWVQNPSAVIQIPFSPDFSGDRPDNFYVDSEKFFYLVDSYDYLILEDTTFRNGNDTFNLRHIKEDIDVPEFSLDPEDWGDYISLLSNSDKFYSCLFEASVHVDDDVNSTLNGIFVSNGRMVSSDRVTLYETIHDFGVGDITLTSFAVKLLPELRDDTIYIGTYGDNILIRVGEVNAMVSQSQKLEVPPNSSDSEFVEKYNHDSYVSVNAGNLMDILKFIAPFTKDAVKNRVKIFLNDSKELSFEVVDSNYMLKSIPVEHIENYSTFEGNRIWVSSSKVRKIASQLLDSYQDNINIQFSPESPALNFTSSQNSETHVIYARINDDEDDE